MKENYQTIYLQFPMELMIFEIFPIGNKGFEKLKNILINKKIIKGEEYEWNI